MARTIRSEPTRREARWDDTDPSHVPADPWGSFADPGIDQAHRLAAAEHLGLCTHHSRDGERIRCGQADDPPAGILALAVWDDDSVFVRAELTAYANGF